jgi:hypothetical protein
VKINDAAAIDRMGLDRQRLARLSVESYLQQILVGRFRCGQGRKKAGESGGRWGEHG